MFIYLNNIQKNLKNLNYLHQKQNKLHDTVSPLMIVMLIVKSG
jgi:hypothetical protein